MALLMLLKLEHASLLQVIFTGTKFVFKREIFDKGVEQKLETTILNEQGMVKVSTTV